MPTLKWRKVGREYHSTDGRFEIYCSSHTASFYGSHATWDVVDNTGRKPTFASSLPKAQAAAQRRLDADQLGS